MDGTLLVPIGLGIVVIGAALGISKFAAAAAEAIARQPEAADGAYGRVHVRARVRAREHRCHRARGTRLWSGAASGGATGAGTIWQCSAHLRSVDNAAPKPSAGAAHTSHKWSQSARSKARHRPVPLPGAAVARSPRLPSQLAALGASARARDRL